MDSQERSCYVLLTNSANKSFAHFDEQHGPVFDQIEYDTEGNITVRRGPLKPTV